jgi:transketolase
VKSLNKKIRNTFAETVTECAKKDKNLVVMVGDISHGIFESFRNNFSDRYFNIGICEQAMVNLAAGLSIQGLNPVVHTIAPFIIERAYEQIKLDFGYQKLHINLVSVGGSFDYSKLGCSHHCYTDLSLMSHFKDSVIVLPGSNIEFDYFFKKIYKNKKINYFRIPEFNHKHEFKLKELNFPKAIKISSGKDITLVVTGYTLKIAKEVFVVLKKKNIECEILYYNVLKPFDKEALVKSVIKTKRLLVIEEFSSHDGIYNICTKKLNNITSYKSEQIAISDFVRNYGTYEELLNMSGINMSNIVKKSLKLFED